MAVDVGQRNVLVGHRPSSLPTCINDVTDWRKGHWRVLAPIWFDFFFSFSFSLKRPTIAAASPVPHMRRYRCCSLEMFICWFGWARKGEITRGRFSEWILRWWCKDSFFKKLRDKWPPNWQPCYTWRRKGEWGMFLFFFSSLAFPSLFRDCCVRFKGKSRWHLARSPTANRAWYGNEEMNSKVSHNLLIVVNKWNLNFLERWRVYDTRLIRNRATNVTQCEGEK